MPLDRFIHPCLGHSEKVSLLTDLEYRVWNQYILSADDFGVMRFSAITLQADNDALHAKPTRTVQRALERVVDVRLIVDFEHQKRKYVCQLDWQKWQKVSHPNRTILPAPPAAILLRCDELTRTLFLEHHPQSPSLDASGDASEEALEEPQTDHLRGLMAKGLGLKAYGLRERFSIFWKHYPRKVGKDDAWKAWQKRAPSDELLKTMLAVLEWQRKQDDWLREGGRFCPHPSTWLNQGRWEDEPSDMPPIAPKTLAAARNTAEFLKS